MLILTVFITSIEWSTTNIVAGSVCLAVGVGFLIAGLRSFVRALTGKYKIPMEEPYRSVVDRAAEDCLDAGVPKLAVWRGINGVDLRFEDHGYDAENSRGVAARHHGSSISIDPKVDPNRYKRIVRWETIVNGVGRKWKETRGTHEIEGRAERFKDMDLL